MSVDIRHLTPNDLTLMEALLTTFGEAFNEVDTYTSLGVSIDRH
jgi:aminoglycoside 3-N-acetyltransferase I